MRDFASGLGIPARIALAYALFLLLGLTGAHRWFLGRYRSALAMSIGCLVMLFAAINDYDLLGGIVLLPMMLVGLIDLFFIPVMASDLHDNAYSLNLSLPSSSSSSSIAAHEAATLKISLANVQRTLVEAKETIEDMNSHFDEEYASVTSKLEEAEKENSALRERLGPIQDLDEEIAQMRARLFHLQTTQMQSAQDRLDEVDRKRIDLESRLGPITLFDQQRVEMQSVLDRIRSVTIPDARAEADAMIRAAQDRSDQIDRKRLELEARLGPISLFDQQQAEMQAVIDRIRTVSIPAAQAEVDAIKSEYADKRTSLDLLLGEIAKVEERISFAELGVYEPHFDFADAEGYRKAIENVRTEIKRAIAEDRAVDCTTAWTVGKSEKEGERMIKRQKKLTLRAFNGESDAAIASVRWNNVSVMENRILRSQTAIDKANESLRMTISSRYVKLKLKELRLVHEHREKQRQEKEALKEEQRAQREEEELQRRALEAEREEARYQRMLDKAKAEAARGDKSAELRKRIAELEQNIADAAAEKERAKAMAELTKCGYVYVISNVGSFGENVVKIGLTRRLEPEDRVRELSGASVPFAFDIHAMIYSEQAPELEHALHREFDAQRVNMANHRKEFFRCDLDRIEAAVRKVAPDAHFTRDVAGDEWRQTVDMRSKRLESVATV
jgi:predicted nuclease with TOPRIM domain